MAARPSRSTPTRAPCEVQSISIDSQTLTITEAGSGYLAAGPVTLASSGIPTTQFTSTPYNMATDSSGNVYLANYNANAITEWIPNTQTLTNVISSGLNHPGGVALDSSGDIDIANVKGNDILEWNATTQMLTTVISSGLNNPGGVAVDSSGNLYIADTNDGAIKEWNATTHNLTTLVSVSNPLDVVLDAQGNLYYDSLNTEKVGEWNASTQSAGTLFQTPGGPNGLAVDSAGNVYAALGYYLEEWHASTQTTTTIESMGGPGDPDVAVDGSGNLYYVYSTFSGSDSLIELPRAFVQPIAANQGAAGGSGTLHVVTTPQPLTGVFAPTSSQSWLSIGSATDGTNGQIDFTVAANTPDSVRTADISVLGSQIPVIQLGSPLVYEVTTLGEGAGMLTGGQGTSSNPYSYTTLRAAIAAANADGNADTIEFDPSLFTSGPRTLTLSTVGDTTAGPSDFDITGNITIVGPSGSNGLTLSNLGTTQRFFYVSSSSLIPGTPASLTLDNLTLSDGEAAGGSSDQGGGAAGMGGAIFNLGSLTLIQSTLSGNTALGGSAGYGSTTGGGGPRRHRRCERRRRRSQRRRKREQRHGSWLRRRLRRRRRRRWLGGRRRWRLRRRWRRRGIQQSIRIWVHVPVSILGWQRRFWRRRRGGWRWYQPCPECLGRLGGLRAATVVRAQVAAARAWAEPSSTPTVQSSSPTALCRVTPRPAVLCQWLRQRLRVGRRRVQPQRHRHAGQRYDRCQHHRGRLRQWRKRHGRRPIYARARWHLRWLGLGCQRHCREHDLCQQHRRGGRRQQ